MAQWMVGNLDLNVAGNNHLDMNTRDFLRQRLEWVCEDELYIRRRNEEPVGARRGQLPNRRGGIDGRRAPPDDLNDGLWRYLGPRTGGPVPVASHNQVPEGGHLFVPPVVAPGPGPGPGPGPDPGAGAVAAVLPGVALGGPPPGAAVVPGVALGGLVVPPPVAPVAAVAAPLPANPTLAEMMAAMRR